MEKIIKRVVFVTNFMSPHTLPLCDSLFARLGGRFVAITTTQMSPERRALGYHLYCDRSYILDCSLERGGAFIQSNLEQADVIMFTLGSVDSRYLRNNFNEGKAVLLLSERLFKRGWLKLFDPRLLAQFALNLTIRRRKVWLLSLGYYVGPDFCLVGFPRDRVRTFGYFPATDSLALGDLVNKKAANQHVRILWVGRMIDVKRPQDVVHMANRLMAMGSRIDWRLELAGIGPELSMLGKLIDLLGLADRVTLLGNCTQNQISARMREADIVVVTSNRREGWGAVVNEGMARACAVVATEDGGGAKELIIDRENGRLYQAGDIESLALIVRELIEDSSQRRALGQRAYETICELWNAEIAAQRLVDWVRSGYEAEYTEGPLSRPKSLIRR